MSGNSASQDIAAGYLRENFRPADRLAVVLVHKRTGGVLQRLASAERIAAPDFLAWLRHKNAGQNEVYISMNALHQDAHGRTKTDVEAIRHVYLDFDDHGTEAVERLLKRPDLPRPNYVLSSSPGKWQVVWKVEGFGKEQAEELQRGLSRENGGRPGGDGLLPRPAAPRLLQLQVPPETFRRLPGVIQGGLTARIGSRNFRRTTARRAR